MKSGRKADGQWTDGEWSVGKKQAESGRVLVEKWTDADEKWTRIGQKVDGKWTDCK